MDNLFFEQKYTENDGKTKYYNEDQYAIDLQESIIKRILFLCRTRKMSMNELARKSGLTPSTVKSIIYGKSKNTGILTIRYLCIGFEISLEEFFHSRLFFA